MAPGNELRFSSERIPIGDEWPQIGVRIDLIYDRSTSDSAVIGTAEFYSGFVERNTEIVGEAIGLHRVVLVGCDCGGYERTTKTIDSL